MYLLIYIQLKLTTGGYCPETSINFETHSITLLYIKYKWMVMVRLCIPIICFYNLYYLYVGYRIYHNHLTIVLIEIGLECIKSMCTTCTYVFTSYTVQLNTTRGTNLSRIAYIRLRKTSLYNFWERDRCVRTGFYLSDNVTLLLDGWRLFVPNFIEMFTFPWWQ